MSIAIVFFWISLALLFFCYVGYGIFVFLINAIRFVFFKKPKRIEPDEKLPVTLIIAAYNEESILEQKIENTLSLNYPSDKLNIIFITDGSSDRSSQIIEKYPVITLMHQQERRGKLAAMKRAMRQVKTPFVIFSDANSILNKESIGHIMSHYYDLRVGGVAGEKKIFVETHPSAVGEAEGIYWKYESFIKRMEAGFNTVIGAAGELFSIRTELFKELHDEMILDDFLISMEVCLQGYKIAYEPRAFAAELPSVSIFEEEKRKIRIAAGAYQSIGYLKNSLNIFKHPVLCFQYFSRRLLRWVFCPVMLVILFFSNLFVASNQPGIHLYSLFMYAQLLFYFSAILGWLSMLNGWKLKWPGVSFYFVFMNYCLVKGFIKYIQGHQTVLWKKALRQPAIGSR